MKRFFLTLVALSLFMSKGFGQEAIQDGAVITFERSNFVDTIPLNGVAQFEFVFTNTGNQPLIILSCRACCGVSATCSREPILPGETGVIIGRQGSSSRAGTFIRTFTVVSNAINSHVSFSMRWVILPANE